ncbi:MAG: YmdB family metallophosphoesterase [Clostridia bacterium]|nr:YmdB family metallophosphoesterase [Clostridia bacterium]
MKILAIGDIVGNKCVDYLADRLFLVRGELGVDMVVANGENASDIHGISAKNATDILAAGVDVITLGNHSFARKDICEILSGDYNVIRPANYPPFVPGIGHIITEVLGYRILCMNVMGTALMEPMACPFETVENILTEEKGNYDFSLLDIHAEATSEKIALARYFDGRINIIFGTHTHVTTADEQILPRGTGYITDLGMSGPVNGVLGTDASVVIERMRTKIPARFVIADGEIKVNGTLFEIDTETRRIKSVRRVKF